MLVVLILTVSIDKTFVRLWRRLPSRISFLLLLFNLLLQVLQYLHLFLLPFVFLFLFDTFLFLVMRATDQASFGQIQTL